MSAIIQARGLTKRFGAQAVVDSLSFSVPTGSICGFLGPNGAGKTTTMRLLLGLMRPTSGEVEVFGLPPGDAKGLARLGALVEQPSLYGHLTGRENVEATRVLRALPASETDRVLSLVALSGDARKLVKSYSLGMRQRLGVAIAMLGSPELLILDEPTNGLDPAGIQDMRELIRSLPGKNGTTVFLSSHILAEVEQIAANLVVIHKGRLRYQGALTDLCPDEAADLQVRVDNPQQALQLLVAAGFSAHLDGSALRIAGAGADAAQIASHLVSAGIAMTELVTLAPNLERRFMALVGDR